MSLVRVLPYRSGIFAFIFCSLMVDSKCRFLLLCIRNGTFAQNPRIICRPMVVITLGPSGGNVQDEMSEKEMFRGWKAWPYLNSHILGRFQTVWLQDEEIDRWIRQRNVASSPLRCPTRRPYNEDRPNRHEDTAVASAALCRQHWVQLGSDKRPNEVNIGR